MPSTSTGLAEEIMAPDEAAVVGEFIAFLRATSARRYPTGVVRRFNQGRHAGCVEAEFTVLDSVPAAHRVGLFARPRTYPAFIRFASAASTSDREKDVRGMSIKVRPVEGENLTAGETAQDFILNSHPVMMVPDTRAFLELLRANEAGGFARAWYFLSHPAATRIALASRQNPTSHLDIAYWSTTPYLYGDGRAVKYIARPQSSVTHDRPRKLTDNYLREALADHLAHSDATFDFMVQFQADSRSMPIEDASIEWKEQESPYIPVARIRIPQQRLDAPGRETACEQVAFNPWHCLADHRPLGNFNRARRDIYHAMASFRAERVTTSSDTR
jgi:catalase